MINVYYMAFALAGTAVAGAALYLYNHFTNNGVAEGSFDIKSIIGPYYTSESNPILFNSNFKPFSSYAGHRDVIVHLYDWKYKEIEAECPSLHDIGYAAVQLSPVTVYKSSGASWNERFHVLSYDFNNEFGSQEELEHMIKECNKNKIKVFVDVVINNMAPSSEMDEEQMDLKKVLYTYKDGRSLYLANDFHPKCDIHTDDYKKESNKMDDYVIDHKSAEAGEDPKCNNFQDAMDLLADVRNVYQENRDEEGFEMTFKLREHTKKQILWTCRLNELPDLKQIDDEGRPVKQIIKLFEDLVFLGVSGFRILTADFMDPKHLRQIYEWLPRQTSFIYHDVYDPLRKDAIMGELVLNSNMYTEMTRATDYRYARLLSRTFLSRKTSIGQMYQLQKELDLLPSGDSVVFINNFITLEMGNAGIGLNHLEDVFIYPGYPLGDKAVQLAIAFMLTSNHGIPLITSSYNKVNKKPWKEHSWPSIKQLVGYRNELKKYNNGVIPPPDKFMGHSWSQASYCLGTIGYVIFNNEFPERAFKKDVDTCFDKNGVYCDIFGGGLNTGADASSKPCMGNSMLVTSNGKRGNIEMKSTEGFAAFHIGAVTKT